MEQEFFIEPDKPKSMEEYSAFRDQLDGDCLRKYDREIEDAERIHSLKLDDINKKYNDIAAEALSKRVRNEGSV